MQDFLINFILKVNKKYFFKKSHPFNIKKDWTLNLNYSDFEYNHTSNLLSMYSKILDLDTFKNKKILEIGCWGWWKSVYIAEKYNGEVVWIDINDDFLKQANKFAKEKKVEDFVKFYNKSAISTWFDNETFDLVIMSDVIEHIPKTQELFNEVFRVLKKWWIIIFDFAPYYHYFWHHLWDTIQIPWIHLFFTDDFLIKLYKKSTNHLVDWENRVNLRIWRDIKNKEVFHYLNKISRKNFEEIILSFINENNIKDYKINYHILKNINFFSKIPLLREVFIKHIIWYIKK